MQNVLGFLFKNGTLLLQIETAILLQNTKKFITKYLRFFIFKCDIIITNCGRYYNIRLLLQNEPVLANKFS